MPWAAQTYKVIESDVEGHDNSFQLEQFTKDYYKTCTLLPDLWHRDSK